jgi:biopolymer transport protein ExbD
MAMRLASRSGVVSDINVTPMADIMIVLLIIFMVTIPIVNGPPLPLPEARYARAAEKNAVALVVTPRGTQVGGGAPMDLATLTAYLAARVEASPDDISVLVQADRGADYARVASVLQACHRAGVEEIGLATSPRVAD